MVEGVEDRVEVAQRPRKVERLVERLDRYLGVGFQQRSEIASVRPMPVMALRCTIRYASSRVFPARTSARRTGWLNTSPWLDRRLRNICSGKTSSPAKQSRETAHHVVRELGRIGQHDTLDRRVRDVALVPQGDVLEPGLQIRPAAPATSPEIVSAEIGLRLCGIADEPFWPGLNPSRTSLTSVRCRCRSSTATASHVVPDRRAGPEELGVAVARDHLRRRHRGQAERAADVTPRPRAGRSSRCRPRHSASSPTPASSAAVEPGAIAVDLQRPQRDLGTERRRLGVDAVGPADHHRVAVGAGEVDERAQQLRRRRDQLGRPRRASPSTAPCRRRRSTSARSGSTMPAGPPIASCTTSTKAATS